MTADGIPVLLMRLTPGQRVTCNFQNLLPDTQIPEGTSIHWHGIELDNDSDGTAVTQDAVKNNQSYTYRFIAPRPGIFWFHSHMVPGDTLWAGMYGVIIVQGTCEAQLIPNVLPGAQATEILAIATDRYAHVGDLFVLTVTNETGGELWLNDTCPSVSLARLVAPAFEHGGWRQRVQLRLQRIP